MIFGSSFADEPDKQTQWTAFVGKPGLEDAPGRFAAVAAGVALFLRPVALALVEGQVFKATWKAPGPWS
jgi:hypothetical protein